MIAFLSFWSFTFAAVYHVANKNAQSKENSSESAIEFYLIFSLYWTTQVVKNIAHVTSAGAVASWWLMPQLMSPTKPAFMRSITTSIGSICFGSLIVAILQSIRYLARSSQNRGGAFVDCILSYIERMIKFVNKYSYTQVAIYGFDFITATKSTGALLKAQLFEVIINDDLSSTVLVVGSLLGKQKQKYQHKSLFHWLSNSYICFNVHL
jgi:hypothetical protein